MGPLDALWHLLNLLLPSAGMGLIAGSLSKLLWRTALAGVAWRRLVAAGIAASAAAAVLGLLLTGRDGRMTTYACMVLACAMALWWTGFRPQRR